MAENKVYDFGEEEITESSNINDILGVSMPVDEFNITDEFLFEDIDDMECIDKQITPIQASKGLIGDDEKQLESIQAEVDAAAVTENVVEEKEIAVQRSETPEEIEKGENSRKMIIEAHEFIKECIEEGVNIAQTTGMNAERVRTYSGKAIYYKQKHAKAKESDDNPFKKLAFMAIACIAVGAFGGVYANSFWVAKQGHVNSMLNCAFSWLMEFDTLPVTMSPLNMSAFMAGFGVWAGLMVLIMFFSWDSSQRKKRNRDGKEHGSAKLMDSSSFKKYRNRFMER